MPWSETDAMEQRTLFIRDWLKHRFAMTELCTMYGVSRKTGYKWVSRYLHDGPDGMLERSHAAYTVHNRTAADVEELLLAQRLKHPSWGGKKIHKILSGAHPELDLPHVSTINDIFKRNGLVHARPRRRAIGHPGRPNSTITLPNDCWSIDFKGQFRTGDGQYCYPLTITDNYSRFLLACQALPATAYEDTKAVMTRVFRQYGLPRTIRSDNGSPFAAASLGRLSRLSVWWIKLGVFPELIEPGKPQQNGRHERMHKTLKHETTKPPAFNARAQQRRFNLFRTEFNNLRPHEALDQETPASYYSSSPTKMPEKLDSMHYPDRFEVRYVSANGGIRWHKQWVSVTTALVGEYVGLEEIDDGEWDVYFGAYKLGRLHERLMKIEDRLGRFNRNV